MISMKRKIIIITIIIEISTMFVWRTWLFKPARMRVAFSATAGILSAFAPLLIKKTVLLLSEVRQAFSSGKNSLTSPLAPS